MTLRYFGVPNLNPGGNYQCGIVGSLGGRCATDCRFCVTPIGNTSQMAQVLNRYQALAADMTASRFRGFRATPTGRISPRAIISEIEGGRPVIAGISPSGMGAYYPPGMSEHVALIVGYEVAGNELWLNVNDPMPYRMFGYDPYLRVGGDLDRRGSYWISYSAFAAALGYKDSILLR